MVLDRAAGDGASNAGIHRYQQLADSLEAQIRSAVYQPGDKLPSIRRLHVQSGLSITTVYHAFIELERRGWVEARRKSGYFVAPRVARRLPPPKLKRHRARATRVTVDALAREIVAAMGDPTMLQLGGTITAPALLPTRELHRCLRGFSPVQMQRLLSTYEDPTGCAALKQQIARRHLDLPRAPALEDIVVTNGCIEAVSLGLRAVAGPGDTIVVESPTYPWFLQVIEDLRMRALEVPTDPQQGIDLDRLEAALARHRVRACLVVPNFHNPLGFVMPRPRKQALVEMMAARDLPIIEDDIHGDLFFGAARPPTLKAFDRRGLVLYCSSFSKTLAPGLRIGWILPGRFSAAVTRLKVDLSIATPGLTQQVVAAYLQGGAYERHLRRLRQALKGQAACLGAAIARHFPDGTRATQPAGGLTLWIELNRAVNGLDVFQQARRRGIAILPGSICSTTDRYGNCIRLSFGFPWGAALEAGIARLARIVRGLAGNGSQTPSNVS
jgi:DNA-binding transcriptional MocR family regulator